jgi:hypothetical protein
MLRLPQPFLHAFTNTQFSRSIILTHPIVLLQVRFKSQSHIPKARSWDSLKREAEPSSPRKTATSPIKPKGLQNKPPEGQQNGIWTPQSFPKLSPEIPIQLSPTQEFVADLLNWQKSKNLLPIIINFAASVIFCMWIYERHRSQKAKAELDDSFNQTSEKGKLVPGPKEERFITPSQEWFLENFTLTPMNYNEGRYWTVFTNLFMHQSSIHLTFNIIASSFILPELCPLFGTIPVGLAFLTGGLIANIVMVKWMEKRGREAYQSKYPGQFYGAYGMTAANLSVLGFGTGAHPFWKVRLFQVIPIKMGHVILVAWITEAVRYWMSTGWDKIQSSV